LGTQLRAEYEHVNSKAKLADHNDLGKLVEQQMELSHKLIRTVASLSEENIEQHGKSRETSSAVSVGLTKQLDNLKSTLLVKNSQLEKRCRELEETVNHLKLKCTGLKSPEKKQRQSTPDDQQGLAQGLFSGSNGNFGNAGSSTNNVFNGQVSLVWCLLCVFA
jgi:hypothetical protein